MAKRKRGKLAKVQGWKNRSIANYCSAKLETRSRWSQQVFRRIPMSAAFNDVDIDSVLIFKKDGSISRWFAVSSVWRNQKSTFSAFLLRFFHSNNGIKFYCLKWRLHRKLTQWKMNRFSLPQRHVIDEFTAAQPYSRKSKIAFTTLRLYSRMRKFGIKYRQSMIVSDLFL